MLMKGKELYTAMCQHCHGEKGDGNGPMVLSGAYVGVPAYADRSSLSDGQIFYSIKNQIDLEEEVPNILPTNDPCESMGRDQP